MHSHINIQANGIDIPVDEGFKLSIDDQNPLWNDNEMFSYPVQIPLDGARAIFKNIEDPDSDMRPTDFEHIPVQISVDGMPFRSGTAKMTDAEELSDAITMNVDAADHSLNDLIGNLKCRDIPVRESDHEALRIGEKIGNVKCTVKYQFAVKVDIKKASDPHYYTSEVRTVTGDFEPQALGFSFPGKCEVDNYIDHKAKLKETRVYNDDKKRTMPKVQVSYINVSQEYGAMVRTVDGSVVPALFANARVCYKHHGKESDGTTSSNLVDKLDDDKYEGKYPYWVLDADRPQSGICFYVLYFLDCLFDYLGVTFDKTALMAIPDMKRLVFFTTHCKYDTETLWGTSTYPKFSASVNNPSSDGLKSLFSKVNDWLDSRGCGGTLSIEAEKTKSIQSFISGKNTYVVGQGDVRGIEVQNAITYASYSANILAMFANNENFPEESVSTVLDSLQNQFGIRFHYDYEQRKVTAYLYRDVYRSAVTPIKFKGNLLSAHKVTEKITGVRVAYSAESSSTEQKENLRYGKTDYDTDYDYIDYPQERTITTLAYASIFQNAGNNNDKNVYIDQTTGNAYRVKISKEYADDSDMRPVLFEVGAFKGVELGDCSELNSDFVQEFISDFQPIMFTDVNSRAELKLATGTISLVDDATKTAVDATLNKGQFQPILAAYIDEDMEHEFVKQKIQNALSDALADFYLTETLQLVESYNPSDTDDGNSPLQSYDWGLAIAVMRGGGTDATYQQYDFNYDGFNNARWLSVAGEYALTSDSIDNFGNVYGYKYNGVQPGSGDAERFSLKIRAYKQPEWASSPLCNESVAMRGTFDTFLSEHAHFLLNRKKYILQVEATAAQLVDIPNHWRELYDFDGVIGFINKVSYDISAEEGITQAQIELYSI